MKDKKKVLSVVLAILLIVSAVVPETLFASANNGYINEDCFVKNTFDEENVVYSSEEIEADGKTSYRMCGSLMLKPDTENGKAEALTAEGEPVVSSTSFTSTATP